MKKSLYQNSNCSDTRVTRRVPLVKQELHALPEHLCSPPVFSGVCVTRSLVLCVMCIDCCLSIFFWPSSCQSFDLRILITCLASSNSSWRSYSQKLVAIYFIFANFGYLDLSHRSICCQILWNYLAFQSFDFERNWLRDRPFNLKRGGRGGYGFLFRSEIFFQTTQVRIFIFLVVLNQIIFFLYQHQNIFFSNIGNQNIFLEKKTIPPSPLKLNGRSLRLFQKRVVYTKLYIYVYIFGNRSILPIS